jgi:hypothetical protein
MAYNILIAGAGQLGSRYLQGLSKFNDLLNIYVFDISDDSIKTAQSRWEECNNNFHQVHYIKNYINLPQLIDLAIVSSTANVRVEIIKNITLNNQVNYWILEKILATSISDLNEIKSLTKDSLKSWVNTPMHAWPLYKYLTTKYTSPKNVSAYFLSFNGLACNCIHYIDFISRWVKSDIENIDLIGLKKDWVASKRQGLYEIEGKMSVKFKDGTILNMSSKVGDKDYTVEIHVEGEIWQINENDGHAKSSSGIEIFEKTLLQSELTAIFLAQIINTGNCDLPNIEESINQHIPLIHNLTKHWNGFMNVEVDRLPIT